MMEAGWHRRLGSHGLFFYLRSIITHQTTTARVQLPNVLLFLFDDLLMCTPYRCHLSLSLSGWVYLALYLSCSLLLTRSPPLSLFLTLFRSLALSLALSPTHAHTHTQKKTRTYTRTHMHTGAYIHTHPHNRAHISRCPSDPKPAM